MEKGFKQLLGWATRLGEEVTKSGPFYDQSMRRDDERSFQRSCEVKRSDKNIFDMNRKEGSVIIYGKKWLGW